MFDRPSQVRRLDLSVPSGFCGDRIEIPDSTAEVSLRIKATMSYHQPVVLEFGRDSQLVSWAHRTVRSNRLEHQRRHGAFVRFSERTLRYFREIVE
jgi:hypothetical protein